MRKRLLYLPLPILTLILEALPFGAVCQFANPEGEPWRETFSYFSMTPFGYAHFSPLLTALASCAVGVLLLLYCFAASQKLLKSAKILCSCALGLSLCPILYGISFYSVVGALITLSLGAELLLLFLLRENRIQ